MSVTLNDVIDHLENLHEYNGYYSSCCPFHADKKPSMFIYPDRFYCAACGARGSLEYLLSKVSRGYYVPVSHDISPNWNKWLADCDMRTFSKQAHSFLKRHPEYITYLKKRGIDSMIDDCRLGFRDGYFIFPVFDENGTVKTLIARTGETLQEMTSLRYFSCPFSISGTRGIIYSSCFDLLEKSPYIVIVFGIIDQLSLGMLNIPSLTYSNGKVIPPALLDGWRTLFYIIGDAGEESDAKRLAVNLGWRGRFVSLDYPQGCKDVNDILMKYGKDKVIQLVNDVVKQRITNFSLEVK